MYYFCSLPGSDLQFSQIYVIRAAAYRKADAIHVQKSVMQMTGGGQNQPSGVFSEL
jgi:hypothetical protein